jgi:MFS transporter, ACS family, tartrate transporter
MTRHASAYPKRAASKRSPPPTKSPLARAYVAYAIGRKIAFANPQALMGREDSRFPMSSDPHPSAAVPNPDFESARKKAYWRLMPLLFISYMIAYVDRQNVAVAKLTMMQDLPGFDNKVIGFGAGIFFFGYFLLEVPGTLIVERWSARKWITRIMITWGIMAALTAFVRTPFQFYGVRFLLGLAEAGFFPGVIVYLTHWFTSRDRAKALAIFFVASPLAQIVSPLVNKWLLLIGVDAANLAQLNMAGATPVPAILGLVGWQWIYILWGIPAVLMAFVIFFFLTDKPHQAKWLTPSEREALQSAIDVEKQSIGSHVKHSALSGLADPRVWLLAVAMCCAVTATYAIEFFMPTILKDWYSLDVNNLAWLIVLPPALALIAQPATAWSSDRKRERRWHAVTPLIIAATAMAALPSSKGNLYLTIGLLMVVLAGLKAYMPAFWSLPNLFLANSAAAGSIGLINSLGNLGGFIGPYITGFLEKTTKSFDVSLYVLAISISISATMIFFIATACQKESR